MTGGPAEGAPEPPATDPDAPPDPLAPVRAALDALRALEGTSGPLTEEPLVPRIRFRLDPEGATEGRWTSPRGRLLEIEARAPRPARWLGLHLEFGPLDLSGLRFLGLAARTAAARPAAIRVCLRSGRAGGGFSDLFFPRHILARPGESDHVDMIAPDRLPDLPPDAPWRELVLFLPSTEDLEVAIHDLRIFAP